MIYKIIAKKLRSDINSNQYTVGDQIPNEKQLAEQFAVSRMTIRRAITSLIELGLLSREQGRGTFIIEKDKNFTINNLKSFQEIMASSKKTTKNDVLEFKIITTPLSIAIQLRLDPKDKIFYIRRVRYVNNRPVMVEDSYMPYHLFKKMTLEDMENSKFFYIEQVCNIKIIGSYETCYAIMPDKDIQSLLKVNASDPILFITTLSYSENNEFINYAIIYRNTKDHNYEYHLKR